MNPPSAAQARAAAASGYRKWSGYLATQPNVGLARAWSQAEFENARLCGSQPIAYCSGWDDPGAIQALAAAWNVLPCLDNEGGIRPDGAWAQNWLDASGAGIYGNAPVHRLRARFHVLAAYPTSGDPSGASWNYTARPAGPCGWQWAGTHTQFGLGVDSTWFDDWFAGLHGVGTGALGGDLDQQEHDWLAEIRDTLLGDPKVAGHGAWNAFAQNVTAQVNQVPAIVAALATLEAEIKALPAGSVAAVDLKPVLDAIAALPKPPTTLTGKLA